MKVKPVSKAVPSPIPTAAEAAAEPSLVAPAPAAKVRRGMGALVGAGMLGSLLAPVVAGGNEVDAGTLAATPTTARAVPDPADAEVAARAEAAREAVATVVAPILQKAMDEEGRGAFGCVAIDPPMFLSEAEALNLIEQEFSKVGVKLRRDFEIDGFTRTVPDMEGENQEGENYSRRYPAKQVRASWTFDFGSEDGSLAVEFLTRQDEMRESFWKNRMARSVISYDFPELAQRLRDDFATRINGNPVAIGLFFDPLPRTTVWDPEQKKNVPRADSSFASFSEEELEAFKRDWTKREERNELLHRDALELLREQVRFFLDWARGEGKIP